MSLSTILISFVLGAFVIFYLGKTLLGRLATVPDPREPPYAPTAVPCIGHIVGLSRYGPTYYLKVGRRIGKAIFSLGMPGGRIYIVTSPLTISSVLKLPRVLSFIQIQVNLTSKLTGASEHAERIIRQNTDADSESMGVIERGVQVMHQALTGDSVHQMTAVALLRAMEILRTEAVPGNTVDLFEWTRHVFTQAVTEGVYGPGNPYRDSKVATALTIWAQSSGTLLSGLPPRIFCRPALRARGTVVDAFRAYFASNGPEMASTLVKARQSLTEEVQLSLDDAARMEAASGFGIVLNVVPTAFWTLFHILSDPELHEAARQEAGLVQRKTRSFEALNEINVDMLPFIHSTMLECLRSHSTGAAARIVMQDTIFEDKFLLKKGSWLFMPYRAPHMDPGAWGENVDKFDACRFIKGSPSEKSGRTAFKAFGGG